MNPLEDLFGSLTEWLIQAVGMRVLRDTCAIQVDAWALTQRDLVLYSRSGGFGPNVRLQHECNDIWKLRASR